MQVVALKTGYYEGLRAAGDIFEVPAGITGSWFLPTKAERVERATQEAQDDSVAAGGKQRKKKSDADDLV